MKYLIVLAATLLVGFLFESTSAATFQQREMRNLEVEEARKEAGSGRDSTGRARVKLDVGTEDGLQPPYIDFHHNGGNKVIRPAMNKITLDVRSGFQDIFVKAEGYVPLYLAKGKQFNDGDVVEYQATLSRGTPTPFRVVDQDGNPISRAGITSYAMMIKPNFQRGSSWGPDHRSDADGFVEVNLPEDTERIKLNVFKGGYSSVELKAPVAGAETVEVKLTKLPVTKGVVRDHEGNVVVGAKIYYLGRSNMNSVSGNMGNRKYESPCAKTGKDGTFSTDRLASGYFHTLLVETENQRGIYSVKAARETLDLKLLPPNEMTVKFQGDFERINPRNLMVYQNCRGSDGEGHAFIELPFSYDEEKGVLKVTGIFKGDFNISAGNLGQLFSTDGFEEGQTEAIVKIEEPEIVTRTMKVSFECHGQRVKPQGLLCFREGKIGPGGSSWKAIQYRKIKDGVVTIETEATAISIESDGLVGYVIFGDEVATQLKDLTDGESKEVKIKLEEAGAIRGVVRDEQGNPVATRVEYSSGWTSFQDRSVDSNAEGKFVLTPIRFGATVKIRAGSIGQEQALKTVKVEEGEPFLDIEIVMPAAKPAKSGSK